MTSDINQSLESDHCLITCNKTKCNNHLPGSGEVAAACKHKMKYMCFYMEDVCDTCVYTNAMDQIALTINIYGTSKCNEVC